MSVQCVKQSTTTCTGRWGFCMKIENIALWTEDIDRLTSLFVKYFAVQVGSRYQNLSKGFESCFLSFPSGVRLLVMQTTSQSPVDLTPGVQRMGLTHFAIAVGSEQNVDRLTNCIQSHRFEVLDGPRRTGDDYCESVVLDPDGNRIEITA
jgi:lactoylglutathione lyase